MKKILFIIGLLISSIAFPQRSIPRGGTAGQVMKIASDGSNIAWSNLSGVASVVAPLVLTANTLSITANTFVQNSNNQVNVDLNGKTLSNVSSFTVTGTQYVGTSLSIGSPSIIGSAKFQIGNINYISTQNNSMSIIGYGTSNNSVIGGYYFQNAATGSTNSRRFGSIKSVVDGHINSSKLLFTINDSLRVEYSPLIVKGNGSVLVGDSGTTYNSAVLNVTSTTKGFLPPRMTAEQASVISSPADGLMIYLTSTNGTLTAKGFWGRVDGAWAKLNN